MKLMNVVGNMNEEFKLVGKNVNLDAVEITSLCTDSRKVENGAMFFCIPGLKVDAHSFAPKAYEAGAAALVVERELDIPCPQVLVKDVREAMSLMAAAFYENPAKELKLIGITGTKGKTTTSYMVKSILETAGHKVGMIGTVGSMIGETQIPTKLTTPDPIDFQALLRQMADAGVKFVVMEVSAHAMELRKLAGMRFTVAAFTNLSQDHFDMFGDMENYRAAKMRLFTPDMCDYAVYNKDDVLVAETMEKIAIPNQAFGICRNAEVFGRNIEREERSTSFTLTFNRRFQVEIDIYMTGLFNVYNAMTAAILCDAVGVTPSAIREGLSRVKNVPGRVETLDIGTDYRVILDYAHSPDALENVLKTVRETAKKRVIALFGCGGDRDHEKRPVMGEIGGRLADYCILTSDNPRSEDPNVILKAIEDGIRQTRGEYTVIENRREAIRYALNIAESGDTIVLAGKGHETYQEIKGVKYPFDEKIVVQELLEEI